MNRNGLTVFQKAVTKEHCIAICKMLHFTLKDEQLEKLTFSYKYTWVEVQFRVKDYGFISFGIDNHDSGIHLFGDRITKQDITDAIKRKAIWFKVWRFSDDEIAKREAQAKIYLEQNFNQPTVEEFHKIYYKD